MAADDVEQDLSIRRCLCSLLNGEEEFVKGVLDVAPSMGLKEKRMDGLVEVRPLTKLRIRGPHPYFE